MDAEPERGNPGDDPMIGVYFAARYSRHPELRGYAARLESLGCFRVTSRWLAGGHEIAKEGSTQAAEAERRRFAEEDLADIRKARWFVCFTEQPRTTLTRGGRHVEFGYALDRPVHIFVVGPAETVFHTLPEVRRYETWEEFLAAAERYAREDGDHE
jgi:hypothetical protein